jgi:hypothetical protein
MTFLRPESAPNRPRIGPESAPNRPRIGDVGPFVEILHHRVDDPLRVLDAELLGVPDDGLDLVLLVLPPHEGKEDIGKGDIVFFY